MKKQFLLALLALSVFTASAQPDTLRLKPGPQQGQDAMVFTNYGCTLNGASGPTEGLNFGTFQDMRYTAWTYNSVGCSEGVTRSLIRFDALNSFSSAATIISARLYLFGVPASPNHYANSSWPGSPYGTTNEGWVERVIQPWDEFIVNWLNQPNTTVLNRVPLPATTSYLNFDTSVDVTQLVKDILTSDQNYGFRLSLQNETTYRNAIFATSDHPDPALWPELVIIYNNPVSVAQVNGGSHLSISPNPANGAVQVALPVNNNGSVSLQVTDVTGKVVFRQQLAGAQSLKFSVSGWAKGLYLVQVTGDNWRAVEKLTVQ